MINAIIIPITGARKIKLAVFKIIALLIVLKIRREQWLLLQIHRSKCVMMKMEYQTTM